MKIATSELEHLREEVKNCHQIIKDLQKKREFVGLTDEEMRLIDPDGFEDNLPQMIQQALKEKNT